MKLYYSPGACSLAPHIVLQETGMRYATENVNLRTHQAGQGQDYYGVNKKGYVPTLELDNGQRLTEAAVVLQYIADQKPDAKLLPPPGTWERYRSQEWLNFIATEMHKGFAPLWNPNYPEAARNLSIEKLNGRFDFLADHLSKNEFLMGSQFTAPDAYLFTVLNWAPILKVDLSKWPALMAYRERISQRPTVQAVMKGEGLVK